MDFIYELREEEGSVGLTEKWPTSIRNGLLNCLSMYKRDIQISSGESEMIFEKQIHRLKRAEIKN